MKLFQLVLLISPLWSSVWPHFLFLSLSRYTHIHTCNIYACISIYLSIYWERECIIYWCSPGVQAQSTSQRIHSNTFSWLTFNRQSLHLPLTHQWSTSISGLLSSPKILTFISKPQWLKLNISTNKTCYLPRKPILLLYSSSINPIFVNTNVVNLASQTSGSLPHILLIVKPYWLYRWSISIVTTSLHSDFNSGFLISLLDILKFWVEV